MPRIQRSNAAIIEFSIPLTLARGGNTDDEDDEDSCFICAHDFCAKKCLRRAMTTRCCSHNMCCGCAVRLAKECTCNDECEEIIIKDCPFCRELNRLGALEIFLGTRPLCEVCAPQATPAPTSNEPQATPQEAQTPEASVA